MAEKPSELQSIYEKCNGPLISANCKGSNDIALKQPEILKQLQTSTINQKSANIQHHDYDNVPDNMRAVSPENSFIEDKKGLRLVYRNETKKGTLNVRNHGGNPYTAPADVACELISAVDPSHSIGVKVARSNSKPGEYNIDFLPTNKGKYLLHIKVDGVDIEGSPFVINVIDKLDANNAVEIITGVHSPQGIAVNTRGEIIVVEYMQHCVSIFDSAGKKIKSIGTKGSGRGQFEYPCGVALDEHDNILVTDGRNDRIQKFSPNGEFMETVGTQGSNDREFCIPVGIGINPYNRKIYVTESDGNRVQILNPDLTYDRCFGTGGTGGIDRSGDARFNKPKDVAFDSAGNVYVADNEHSQIQVFTAEGVFLRRFGTQGREDGQMEFCSAVSIDNNDIVYVTDLYNSRILVFTKEGEFLTSFGSRGTGIGELKDPRGIFVDHQNGVIYVSDYSNDRILKFWQ